MITFIKHITILYLTILSIQSIQYVRSHSYLCSPTSRSNQCSQDRGQRGIGPCDATYANSITPPITAKRGDKINLQWPRNNHPGGFIQIAWAPAAQSGDQNVFNQNIVNYSCHETPCSAGNQATTPCMTSTVIPPHLTDGVWTMQWLWYGGGFGLADYYSCVDYKVSGGTTGTKPTPVFLGGDVTTTDKTQCGLCVGCTDVPLKCTVEPCLPGLSGSNPIGPLGHGAVLSGSSSGGSSSGGSSSGGSSSGGTTPTTPTEDYIYGNQKTNAHYINTLTVIDPSIVCKTLAEGKYICDSDGSLGTCANGIYYKLACAPNTHCSNGYCILN